MTSLWLAGIFELSEMEAGESFSTSTPTVSMIRVAACNGAGGVARTFGKIDSGEVIVRLSYRLRTAAGSVPRENRHFVRQIH
jgi:hypothetical protein